MGRGADLERIQGALEEARRILGRFTPGRVEYRDKQPGDPVTEADLEVDAALSRSLPRQGEGWLSEETPDNPARLGCRRVWVVDPIDGTREFVAGIPEWVVSIGLVEDGRAVAGGILNPQTGLLVIGSIETGVTLNGVPCATPAVSDLAGADILASRSETARGEWERFAAAPFVARPTGSVAHKLALVAAGLADATWTLNPKCEWDVCGGVALVLAAGGACWVPGQSEPRFNRPHPRMSGLCASSSSLAPAIREFLEGADVAAGG